MNHTRRASILSAVTAALGLSALLGMGCGRPAAAQQAQDLVLTDWDKGAVALGPGMTLENGAGTSPTGEALSRIQFGGKEDAFDVLTRVNLPPTAGQVSCFVKDDGAAPHGQSALFTDSQGFTGVGATVWSSPETNTYTTPVTGPRWSWRVDFFKAKPQAPFSFRGLRMVNRDGQDVAMTLGPMHVTYTPDDAHWLYTDLQPKVISSRDGVLPPLTLRVANLGTTARTFALTAVPVERSGIAVSTPPVALGTVTLGPNQLKSLPVTLPLKLLGRYTIHYQAGDGQMGQDEVAVVNARDLADGFRHQAAARTWFSVPTRQPGNVGGKAQITVAAASNGIGPVPIFPIGPRVPRHLTPWTMALAQRPPTPGTMTVLETQLSPAWLLRSGDTGLTLFGDSRKAGLGAPTHIAFATAAGTRVLAAGVSLDAAALKTMAQPWLLVWWQGADGWRQWDAPSLVVFQHRPSSIRLDENGVSVKFAGPAGYVTTMPLFGYAKLPQQAAFAQDPRQFRLPPDWPADQLHPWTWATHLPPFVAARCAWWTGALRQIPYSVHETYAIDHGTGSVAIHDAFDYADVPNDWNTTPIVLAPLSPSLALARRGGYPITVGAKLTDCQCATLLGPYVAVEGQRSLDYRLNIGPYWMQAADPNVSPVPAGADTAAARAQSALLHAAAQSTSDDEAQMWDYHDENSIWNMQGADIRDAAVQTAYTVGSGRQDRKGWLQSRVLDTLLDRTRYRMDERGETLTRRYFVGPGIGDFSAGDYGDAGKLGTDSIWDAWLYAYHTGDYQTIADHWDLITSLNVTPLTMSWAGQGRATIAEMGDEAPPMLALARLAYAVGDRETYAAAVLWYARELVHTVIKEGAFVQYRTEFRPWGPGWDTPTETATNLWGSNAGWQGGGFRTMRPGENQWNNFYVRLDDPDTLRFQRKYAAWLPRREADMATSADARGSAPLYFIRTALLGDDPATAWADYARDGAKAQDTPATLRAVAERTFPPHLETLIPPTAPTVPGGDWAQSQSGGNGFGLVSQPQMLSGQWPSPHWFAWDAPAPISGLEWGEKWTFGAFAPAGGGPPEKITADEIDPTATVYTLAGR
jgi:hypothetical protein